MKPLVRRERVDQDIQEAIEYYLEQSPEAALGFIDDLEQAFRRIQRQPGAGSPRYAHELNLPGLRFGLCKRYPYLVFYREASDRIEIWRVLHGSRHIPAWLHDQSA